MPIRKRISDPFGHDYKEMAKRRREGRKPSAPRKPKLPEREPFINAITKVVSGERYSLAQWREFTDPFLGQIYKLWGVDLDIWPCGKPTTTGGVECVGVLVIQRTKTARGINPKITLKGPSRSWYRLILDWIEENNYE